MKKTMTIILMLIYTMSAFGVSAKYHYCMDKLTKINVGFGSGHGCKCNVPVKTNGCCNDKVFYLKTDTHGTTPDIKSNSGDNWTIVSTFFNLAILGEREVESPKVYFNTAQSISPHSIFLLNQNFRI